jgi:hypothetical protein
MSCWIALTFDHKYVGKDAYEVVLAQIENPYIGQFMLINFNPKRGNNFAILKSIHFLVLRADIQCHQKLQ